MTTTTWIWAGGAAFSLLCVVLGLRIRYYGSLGLLAGYRAAPPAERAKYDYVGLRDHVGNGLTTFGVLAAMSTVGFLLDSPLGMWIPFWLSVGVAVIIPLGTSKFLPADHALGGGPPKHPFLRLIVPERALLAMEKGTRNWLIECPCGHKRDYWDTGGIRYKAAGEPRQAYACPPCGKVRWHKVRRKRPGELGGPGNPPPVEASSP